MKKLIDNFIAHHRAGYFGNTEKIYREQAGKFSAHFAGKELSSLTTADMADWIHHMMKEDHLRSNTVKLRVGVARKLLNFAVRKKLIAANPLLSEDLPLIKHQKPDRVPFTRDQYETVLEASRNASEHPAWIQSALMIGWHIGARVSDIARLEWQKCIQFTAKTVTIWPKKKQNVDEKLIIPMDDELFGHLVALYNNRKSESIYVLPKMQRLYQDTPREIDRAYRKLCDSVGLTGHSSHSMRHGFVSRLLNSGTDAIIVSSLTGQTLKQIQTYAHVSVEAKINALNQSKPEQPVRGVAVAEF